MGNIAATPQKSTISSKVYQMDGRNVAPQSKEYRAARKIIRIAKPAIQISAWDGAEEKPALGILLRPQDMEEISLLTRVGNEVEIR
jgi:hypothetical protein